MRLSYSTLALLDSLGDHSAHVILRAWKEEAGILLEPKFLQVYYRPSHDHLVMRGEHMVAAPYHWMPAAPQTLTLEHPLLQDQLWFQKAR